MDLFTFFGRVHAGKKRKSAGADRAVDRAPAAGVRHSTFPAAAVSSPPLQHVGVGSQVDVYWRIDDKYYTAEVKRKRNPSSVYIKYEIDGRCEWIDLTKETVRNPSEKKRRIHESDDDSKELGEECAVAPGSAGESTGSAGDSTQYYSTTSASLEVVSPRKASTTPPRGGPTTKISSETSCYSQQCSPANQKRKNTDGLLATAAQSSSQAPRSSSLPSGVRSSVGQFASHSVAASHHEAAGGKTPVSRNLSTAAAALTPCTLLNDAQHLSGGGSSSLCIRSQHNHNMESGVKAPPSCTEGDCNPAGSHIHNHLRFLQNPLDAQGRPKGNPDYDPRTLKVVERDWLSVNENKKMKGVTKQWWDLKAQYFDAVLLFKIGAFFHMFHMDADVGVKVCDLQYCKGKVAKVSFSEKTLGSVSKKLIRAGYKVARVEETQTSSSSPSPNAVVNRKVYSIQTLGTCTVGTLGAFAEETPVGPLLAIREVLLDKADDENVQLVCEYGVTLIDAVRGVVTIGQFMDDVICNRMKTLLTMFSPSEILLEEGASSTLHTLLGGLHHKCRLETIRSTESFPQSTSQPLSLVLPWDARETVTALRQYYNSSSTHMADMFSWDGWPTVLQAAVQEDAKLAISSLGAALYYLKRNFIDVSVLSRRVVEAYVPTGSSVHQLAIQQSKQESNGSRGEGSAPSENGPAPMDIDQPETLDAENITHMSLDGTTLLNLEILTNSVDHKVAGSLWSKINYTKTPHGSRLLRAWLLRPLFRKAEIDRRADAVQELAAGGAALALNEARSLLSKCGDIDSLLCRFHGMSDFGLPGDDGKSIHPNDRALLYEAAKYRNRDFGVFFKVLKGLRSAAEIPELFARIEIESGLLRKIVRFVDQGGRFPDMAEKIDWFFSNFDGDQAARGLFEPTMGIDGLFDESVATIERIIAELDDYRDEMCANHLMPRSQARSSWKYVNVKPESKGKYLIELPASVAVPGDFIMMGKRGQGHKQIIKYRTPVVEQLAQELERAYEVQANRKEKGMGFLCAKFDSQRALWASAAQATALLDALGALAQTAAKNGFTRPRILGCPPGKSPSLKILNGRHPCVESCFLSEKLVPNDLTLGCASTGKSTLPRLLLLSGPNMGGKSTLLRQTCLIIILAQLGSFVPAEECELTPMDCIFTRLVGRDSTQQSAFYTELVETAAALRGATRRSLVIMDELGRGTNTYEGAAIASATVRYLIERSQCLAMFATHYHSLLAEWNGHPQVLPRHMVCRVENKSQEADEVNDGKITFLYTLGRGVCPNSFGINVARMAGLPEEVLGVAKRASLELEQEISSVEASRSAVSARNAVAEKNRIMEAIQNGKLDDVEALWSVLQETND